MTAGQVVLARCLTRPGQKDQTGNANPVWERDQDTRPQRQIRSAWLVPRLRWST